MNLVLSILASESGDIDVRGRLGGRPGGRLGGITED